MASADEQEDRRTESRRNQRKSDWLTCLNDVTSSNRFTRTNALKRLERSLIPELDVRLSLELLDGSFPLDSTGGDFGSIYYILLGILGDDATAEGCREKSAMVLRDFLAACFGTADSSQESGADAEWETSRRPLGDFCIQFCHVFHERFSCDTTRGSVIYSATTPKERSEEIRLLLAQIASNVLGYIQQIEKRGDVMATQVYHLLEGPAANVEVSSPVSARRSFLGVSSHEWMEASSLLCQSLASSALRDPYPDLKRESCVMIEQLSILFPSTLRMHAEALLRPIMTGTSGSSSRDCLMRHKHSKTRCMGLQATSHILSCCPSDECVDSKGSSGGTLEHLLRHSCVLSCWEEHTIMDKAVSVRLELMKTVGMVTRRMIVNPNHSIIGHNKSKLASHLAILLLVGMSDDTTDVRDLSSTWMFHWANTGVGEWDSSWNMAIQDCLSPALSGFLSSLMPCMVNTIQHDFILANWSVERSVMGLNALCMALTLTRPYRKPDCEHVSAEQETSSKSQTILFNDDARTIAATLLQCVQSNERAISNAAYACAQALGANDNFAFKALGLMLPALSDRELEGSSSLTPSFFHVDLEDEAGNALFSSSPQMIGAALTVMAYMMKGYLALARDKTCRCEISWCSSKVLSEISHALTTDLVIQSAFSSQIVAWALVDMCSTIVKGGQVFHLVQMKSPEIEKPHSTSWGIVLCCVYLMGLKDEFDVYQSAVGALESLSNILYASNDIETILHEYSPTILPHFDQNTVVWNMNEPQPCAFEALLRHSRGSTLGYNFDFVFRILERQMVLERSEIVGQEWTDDAKYSMKIWAMALFETVISKSGFPTDLLHPYTTKLLDSIVLPNLIWKPGKMASALRKLSVATLFSLLRTGGLMTDISLDAVPHILLTLKQNILDDDGTTRELVCLSLGVVFDLLPEPLGANEVNTMYPDLIKCLDNDKHNVRFAAMNAIKAFLKAAQPLTFQGAPIECIVDALLVHMDDPDDEFQTCALYTLTVALGIDSNLVVEKTHAIRSLHRSPEFCDELLTRAEEY